MESTLMVSVSSVLSGIGSFNRNPPRDLFNSGTQRELRCRTIKINEITHSRVLIDGHSLEDSLVVKHDIGGSADIRNGERETNHDLGYFSLSLAMNDGMMRIQ